MTAPRDNWRNPATAWLPPDVERTGDERWIDWPAEEMPPHPCVCSLIRIVLLVAALAGVIWTVWSFARLLRGTAS